MLYCENTWLSLLWLSVCLSVSLLVLSSSKTVELFSASGAILQLLVPWYVLAVFDAIICGEIPGFT